MKRIVNTSFIKKISAALFLTGILLGTSCKKYTQLQPLDALSSTVTFSTAANVELAAAGMYNSAEVGSYNGATPGRSYPFGAASIEQGEMRGEDMVNLAAFYQITYQATYSATTANNVNMWLNLYALINQCNTFIDGVHTATASGVITATAGAAYEGEARFLRALAHHELLIHFSRPFLDNNGANPGVPYRTIAVNTQAAVTEASQVDRGAVADCYTKLLADLDFAEANLPATRSDFPISRAVQGSAIALETRVKLHMGDWAGVISEGAKLGTGAAAGPYVSPIGGYKLTATPDGPFTSNNSNTESVFSIENSSKANGGVNGALPAMLGPSDKGGRGLVATSPNLFNAAYWVSSDSRRTLLQVQQGTSGAQYYFNYKYRDYTNLTDWAPIIRYAEVLLNVAEAYARTTALDPRAEGLLNAVRNRAVAVADQYSGASFTTGNDLIQAILNERRIEFAGEGRRWADISRLANDPVFTTGGIPAKILISSLNGNGSNYDIVNRPYTTPTFAAIPYSNFRFLWPIPNTELAANPVLAKEQNPGY
jgi:starch-binding outer membrane protein, SusD/RagB family